MKPVICYMPLDGCLGGFGPGLLAGVTGLVDGRGNVRGGGSAVNWGRTFLVNWSAVENVRVGW